MSLGQKSTIKENEDWISNCLWSHQLTFTTLFLSWFLIVFELFQAWLHHAVIWWSVSFPSHKYSFSSSPKHLFPICADRTELYHTINFVFMLINFGAVIISNLIYGSIFCSGIYSEISNLASTCEWESMVKEWWELPFSTIIKICFLLILPLLPPSSRHSSPWEDFHNHKRLFFNLV